MKKKYLVLVCVLVLSTLIAPAIAAQDKPKNPFNQIMEVLEDILVKLTNIEGSLGTGDQATGLKLTSGYADYTFNRTVIEHTVLDFGPGNIKQVTITVSPGCNFVVRAHVSESRHANFVGDGAKSMTLTLACWKLRVCYYSITQEPPSGEHTLSVAYTVIE